MILGSFKESEIIFSSLFTPSILNLLFLFYFILFNATLEFFPVLSVFVFYINEVGNSGILECYMKRREFLFHGLQKSPIEIVWKING